MAHADISIIIINKKIDVVLKEYSFFILPEKQEALQAII